VEDLRQMADDALDFMLRNAKKFSCTWAALFKEAPKGDFSWESEEAGDWVPYGSDDLWGKSAYAINLSRKDGEEIVEFVSVDTDGNWSQTGEFSRRKGEKLSREVIREFNLEMVEQHCYFTLLKQSLYSLYVVETGLDPLEDTIGKNNPREVHAKRIAHEIPDLCVSVYKTACK
jgi:hypothetical protein